MPYRHAHYFLLLLIPLKGLAFWRGYFSDLAGASYAFHFHGITATLWILLLAFQSWSIHHRQNSLHRAIGYTSFGLLPLFTVGGLLVLQTMAVKFQGAADPFNVMYGARLGTLDFVSTFSIPWLFYMALRWRRKVHLHARYMLVTVFFLLPPIFARLLPILPPLSMEGPDGLSKFVYCLHLANLLAIGIAFALHARAPKHGRPFVTVSLLMLAQSIFFETVARTEAWETMFASLADVPLPALVSAGLAMGAAAALLGWKAGLSPATGAAARARA